MIFSVVIRCYAGGRTGACLLISFLLFRTKYMRYIMAFWCIFFMRVLVLDFGLSNSVSFLIECSCMASLTLAMTMMRALTFQPLFWRVLINGS